MRWGCCFKNRSQVGILVKSQRDQAKEGTRIYLAATPKLAFPTHFVDR